MEYFDSDTKDKAFGIITKFALGTSSGRLAVCAYELLDVFLGRAIEYQEQKARNKAQIFHEELSKCTIDGTMINAETLVDDYTTILTKYLNDDEENKSIYYANLLEYFTNSKPRKDEKVFLLSTLKQLSSFDVKFIISIIVKSKFALKGSPSIFRDKIADHAKGILVQNGLLTISKNGTLTISSAGNIFCHATIKPEQLTPEAIGSRMLNQGEYSITIFLRHRK